MAMLYVALLLAHTCCSVGTDRPAGGNAVRVATVTEEWRTLIGHTKAIHSIAFSLDHKRLAASGIDGSIRVWQIESGELLFHRKENAPATVMLSPNGTTLFAYFKVAFVVHRVQVRDLRKSRKLKWQFDQPQTILNQGMNMGLSGNGTVFGFCAQRDYHLSLWESTTGDSLGRIKVDGPINAMAFAHANDEIVIAYSGESNVLEAWDVAARKRRRTICRIAGDDQPWRMRLSHDDKLLGEYWSDGSVVLRDVKSGRTMRKREDVESNNDMAFTSKNGLRFSKLEGGNVVDVWELNGEKRLARLKCDSDQLIVQIAFSNDASLVATGLNDGRILLWRIDKVASSHGARSHGD